MQNSNVPRSLEDYITQVSEEIEGRVTKKLSQEFSRTENCILGALARLDDFLKNPLLQGYSGTTPETSRNMFSINQGTNEDDSQSNPHPEAGRLSSGREDRHDMATGVQRERERVWMVATITKHWAQRYQRIWNSFSDFPHYYFPSSLLHEKKLFHSNGTFSLPDFANCVHVCSRFSPNFSTVSVEGDWNSKIAQSVQS